VEAYKGLADVYDMFADDFDYSAWADYYTEIISRAGCVPKRVCDCGCGTLNMGIPLAERGLSVTGVDISEEMLAAAAEKARMAGLKIPLVKQDMCALTLPRQVDAIICACDGVNYLLTDARLSEFFMRCFLSIKKGGCLAFDFSTYAKLSGKLGNAFFGEERDEAAYLWQNTFDEKTSLCEMDITFFARQQNGLYKKFTEKHVQRAHEPSHIAELLEKAGFANIRVYGDKTFAAPDENDMRAHVTATVP